MLAQLAALRRGDIHSAASFTMGPPLSANGVYFKCMFEQHQLLNLREVMGQRAWSVGLETGIAFVYTHAPACQGACSGRQGHRHTHSHAHVRERACTHRHIHTHMHALARTRTPTRMH